MWRFTTGNIHVHGQSFAVTYNGRRGIAAKSILKTIVVRELHLPDGRCGDGLWNILGFCLQPTAKKILSSSVIMKASSLTYKFLLIKAVAFKEKATFVMALFLLKYVLFKNMKQRFFAQMQMLWKCSTSIANKLLFLICTYFLQILTVSMTIFNKVSSFKRKFKFITFIYGLLNDSDNRSA